MNPLLLYLAAGESLYSGAAILALLGVISPFLQRRSALRLRNIAAWMAIVLIVMASPPFPWIVDAAVGVTFLSWFIGWNKVPDRPLIKKMRVATMALILLVLLTLSVAEFPHRRMPVLAGQASDHLVVIGDSISSGIAATEPPWPVVLNRLTGIAVRNLSRPGATVADGLAMAQGVNANDRLILIELGGNDLIAGESSDLFARGLDAL